MCLIKGARSLHYDEEQVSIILPGIKKARSDEECSCRLQKIRFGEVLVLSS